MNRIIKFRIWDGSKFGYVQLGENRISWPDNDFMEHQASTHEFHGLLGVRFPKVVAWQQFTGLSDKNGVEIYEGDVVVRHPDWKYGQEVVRWEDTGFTITSNAADYEVIGNIYENPTLLQTDK